MSLTKEQREYVLHQVSGSVARSKQRAKGREVYRRYYRLLCWMRKDKPTTWEEFGQRCEQLGVVREVNLRDAFGTKTINCGYSKLFFGMDGRYLGKDLKRAPANRGRVVDERQESFL